LKREPQKSTALKTHITVRKGPYALGTKNSEIFFFDSILTSYSSKTKISKKYTDEVKKCIYHDSSLISKKYCIAHEKGARPLKKYFNLYLQRTHRNENKYSDKHEK